MDLVYTRLGFIALALFLSIKLLYESRNKNDSKNLTNLLSTLLILSFYFGLRPVYVGADTLSYYNYFTSQAEWMEIGFTFLNRIIYILCPNFNVFLFVINAIMLINVVVFYYLYTKDLFLTQLMIIIFAFLPYGIQLNINVIRQGLALSILLLIVGLDHIGFFSTLYKKVFKIILYGFSISIHKTMIIFILIYEIVILGMKKNNYISIKTQLIIFLFTILIIVFNVPMLILSLVPLDTVKNKLLHYVVKGYEFKLFLKILGYYFISIIYQKIYKKYSQTQANNTIIRFYNLLIFISALVSFSYTTATRILVVLDFLLPVLFIHLLILNKSNICKKNYLALLLTPFIVYIILYTYYSGMISSFNW